MANKTATPDLQTKEFFYFLCKLHERLTIILDDNVAKGVDPQEEDILLMQELYPLYHSSNVKWAQKEQQEAEVVTQAQIFSDKKAE